MVPCLIVQMQRLNYSLFGQFWLPISFSTYNKFLKWKGLKKDNTGY